MRLADLDPRLQREVEDGILMFDCPHPGCRHRVRVSISSQPYHERDPRDDSERTERNGKVRVWQASGAYPDSLTLTPSINLVDDKDVTVCWHGFITNGEVT